jgi:uncharacterized cupredoxin-like copper-binding protein
MELSNRLVKPTRRAALALSVGFAAMAFGSVASAADTTINVSLWDKGPDSAMMDDAHMAMTGSMMMDMSMATMGIKVDADSVPAGKVTFDVVNDSKDIIHEMVVSPLSADQADLPYIADEYKVDEDAAGHVGEVAELEPGKSGSLSVDLKPGRYILYCNIPGHFVGGMWTILTVTE